MAFGLTTGTTNFSASVTNAIQKALVEQLRAGLNGLPRGAVIPAVRQKGENYNLVLTDLLDLPGSVVTASLTEGIPPAAQQLGMGTQTITATQFGVVTSVTDRAAMQSPFDLKTTTPAQVAHVVADYMDNVALAAIAAHTIDREYATGTLSTTALMDAKGELQNKNVQPIPGVGFYVICNPYALSGLEREASLNGYTDVQAQADAGKLSTGVVSQYRGFTFLPTSKIAGALSGTARTGPTGAFATDIWTQTAHGLSNGSRIQFASLTGGGTNFVINTDYFVVNKTTDTYQLSATRGGAVRDLNTSDVTASTFKSEVFPCYLLGKGSIGAGDIGSLEFIAVNTPDSANPLNQFMTVSAKGVFGAAVVSMPVTTNGAGANGPVVDRIYSFSVMTGLTA